VPADPSLRAWPQPVHPPPVAARWGRRCSGCSQMPPSLAVCCCCVSPASPGFAAQGAHTSPRARRCAQPGGRPGWICVFCGAVDQRLHLRRRVDEARSESRQSGRRDSHPVWRMVPCTPAMEARLATGALASIKFEALGPMWDDNRPVSSPSLTPYRCRRMPKKTGQATDRLTGRG
jgi:hypothetical protein